MVGVLLAVAVLSLLVVAAPPLRRIVNKQVRPLIAEVVPHLLEIVHRPSKLAAGLGGAVGLTLSYVACLAALVHAFGGHLSFASIAVVCMAGLALGALVPTPGGLGAVEGAMAAGLTAAGLPGATAVSTVLLFRLVTFWLPAAPGWLAFAYLQRHGKL
jgi:uncharacterized protein (TIRG00374 family)